MNSTVSIVVPVFNARECIADTIMCVLNQSYTDLELILVDDGSPDRCGEMVDAYAQRDGRVVPVHQPNRGYSAAVKNVLDRSIGSSTPFSTYRGGQMHHTLRYGKRGLWKVVVYGDITEGEKESFRYLAERNAVNDGYQRSEVVFLGDLSELEGVL